MCTTGNEDGLGKLVVLVEATLSGLLLCLSHGGEDGNEGEKGDKVVDE